MTAALPWLGWLFAGRPRRALGAVLVAAAVGTSGAAIYKTTYGASQSGSSCSGTCFYVRDGASGNGTSWTNACDDFAGSCAVSSLTRGATYYVAQGNYAARTFDTAASGTSVITIKGATVASHGDNTGWSDSYAVGTGGNQAHFAYPLSFSDARYFVFDGAVACGVTGGGPCGTASSYGFTVDQPSPCSQDQHFINYSSGIVTHDTWAHIALTACGTSYAVEKGAFTADLDPTQVDYLTYSHIYCNYFEDCVAARRTTSGYGPNHITVEYLYDINQWGDSSHHGEQINLVSHVTDVVVRWSYFGESVPGLSEGVTAQALAANDAPNVLLPCVTRLDFYGNVMEKAHGAEAVIESTSNCTMTDSNFFNNSFSTEDGSFYWWRCNSCTGNTAKNNVYYNMDVNSSATLNTHSYNSYFDTTNTPTETGRQTGTGSPWRAGGLGFYLSSDTDAWDTGGNPSGNTVDADGVSRTSSRGAYQYVP